MTKVILKWIITLIIILLTESFSFGQVNLQKPFIIKGQIKNSAQELMTISFRDTSDRPLTDTIHIDKSGNFYLKTFNVQMPQRTEIRHSRFTINKIFVAPGYDLTITADGKDPRTLVESKGISGIGSESNRYQFMFDSISFQRGDTTHWLDLKEPDFLAYMKSIKKLKDSLARVVFKQPAVNDKFHKHFNSVVQLDIKFYQLYMLVTHVYWYNHDYKKSVSFVRSNIDNKLLDNLYRDEYLISDDYKDWFIASQWLNYLLHLDFKKDSTIRKQNNYDLKKIEDTYQGKAREFTLQRKLAYKIQQCKSLESLTDLTELFELYASTFKNEGYKENLTSMLQMKKMDLLRVQIGKPAPTFILENSMGKKVSLDDFKNKVVYLDLWASWCIPCKEEFPGLRSLYDKYKNDDRIVIISIAVLDRFNEWKKLIELEKPDWIQLFDKEGKVAKAYNVTAVPQFIIIDKQGKIVDFDAPYPSDGKELEVHLEREILK